MFTIPDGQHLLHPFIFGLELSLYQRRIILQPYIEEKIRVSTLLWPQFHYQELRKCTQISGSKRKQPQPIKLKFFLISKVSMIFYMQKTYMRKEEICPPILTEGGYTFPDIFTHRQTSKRTRNKFWVVGFWDWSAILNLAGNWLKFPDHSVLSLIVSTGGINRLFVMLFIKIDS